VVSTKKSLDFVANTVLRIQDYRHGNREVNTWDFCIILASGMVSSLKMYAKSRSRYAKVHGKYLQNDAAKSGADATPQLPAARFKRLDATQATGVTAGLAKTGSILHLHVNPIFYSAGAAEPLK
jgi:hypothetical protein